MINETGPFFRNGTFGTLTGHRLLELSGTYWAPPLGGAPHVPSLKSPALVERILKRIRT